MKKPDIIMKEGCTLLVEAVNKERIELTFKNNILKVDGVKKEEIEQFIIGQKNYFIIKNNMEHPYVKHHYEIYKKN